MLPLKVIPSDGREYNTNNLLLSYTLGEPIASEINSQSYRLNQGFQQGVLRSNSTSSLTTLVPEYKVYPNPTGSILNIEPFSLDIQAIHLYDVHGRLILSHHTSNYILNLSPIEEGFYLLVIVWKNGERSIEKILKTLK